MQPKISVIIPIHNVEKYLSACLESVLLQTFQDWEAICVNDGSTDGCSKILAEYEKKDARIKVITQENQGLSQARNRGLLDATGTYILFLDSDDLIDPQLMEVAYYFAKKEDADMVSFHLARNFSDKPIEHSPYIPNALPYIVTHEPLYFQQKRHKYKILINACSKLLRRIYIKNLTFIPHITMEDYPYVYALFARHPKTVILNCPLYYYTYNPNSISAKEITVKNINDYRIGLTSIVDIYETTSIKEQRFVRSQLIPNILKQQWNAILKVKQERQAPLLQAFTQELAVLDKRGYLRFRGHKLSRYLQYKSLLRKIMI